MFLAPRARTHSVSLAARLTVQLHFLLINKYSIIVLLVGTWRLRLFGILLYNSRIYHCSLVAGDPAKTASTLP